MESYLSKVRDNAGAATFDDDMPKQLRAAADETKRRKEQQIAATKKKPLPLQKASKTVPPPTPPPAAPAPSAAMDKLIDILTPDSDDAMDIEEQPKRSKEDEKAVDHEASWYDSMDEESEPPTDDIEKDSHYSDDGDDDDEAEPSSISSSSHSSRSRSSSSSSSSESSSSSSSVAPKRVVMPSNEEFVALTAALTELLDPKHRASLPVRVASGKRPSSSVTAQPAKHHEVKKKKEEPAKKKQKKHHHHHHHHHPHEEKTKKDEKKEAVEEDMPTLKGLLESYGFLAPNASVVDGKALVEATLNIAEHSARVLVNGPLKAAVSTPASEAVGRRFEPALQARRRNNRELHDALTTVENLFAPVLHATYALWD